MNKRYICEECGVKCDEVHFTHNDVQMCEVCFYSYWAEMNQEPDYEMEDYLYDDPRADYVYSPPSRG